ncbi:putative HTH-type DNA-binding domain-containing acetyltransferase YbfA [Colletotrichum spinosum]|uniref:Putative HTH-type DNA-binding domain-containing acetyltransferase YbfA n=1 Tax=Colletotrichum spinosum TaxID=1347390 RepID=A0A4R8Q1P2_9PEZI|nr:putative HTH-type DNA-binding domain-containing acetyltransferase YbfA [Colletotrichum spinosum]
MKVECEPTSHPPAAITIRDHRPADMGYITHRHGIIYAEEFGHGYAFEALVGRITADFIENFDPASERCWIAEREGQFLGCVMLIRDRGEAKRAQLRCLLVEKDARGLGLGKQLMQLCVAFARDAGYDRLRLRTDQHMTVARTFYIKEGFQLLHSEAHKMWREHAVAETWELAL